MSLHTFVAENICEIRALFQTDVSPELYKHLHPLAWPASTSSMHARSAAALSMKWAFTKAFIEMPVMMAKRQSAPCILH
jgi:hypothetical protein